jgi:hypothetical protein
MAIIRCVPDPFGIFRVSDVEFTMVNVGTEIEPITTLVEEELHEDRRVPVTVTVWPTA